MGLRDAPDERASGRAARRDRPGRDDIGNQRLHVQEALAAFERTQSLSPADRDAAQTQFLTRLSRMTGLIEAPSSRDVAESLLDERRSATHTRLLARVLDIQPMDVPIVVLAFDHYDREPTILTNDATFSTFDPAAHNLPAMSVELVE